MIVALIELLVIVAIVWFVVSAISKGRALRNERPSGPIIDGRAEEVRSPAEKATRALNEFEAARADLKARYPLVFAMLGGYLNQHTISELGGVEAAAREMLADYAARREEVSRELTRLLAENDSEAQARAIVTAACDADFDTEGNRAWLVWLLGRLNAK
jgi:predicted Zn-dependent protease